MKITPWSCQSITVIRCITSFGGNSKILNLRVLMNLRAQDKKWLFYALPHCHERLITSIFSYKLTTILLSFLFCSWGNWDQQVKPFAQNGSPLVESAMIQPQIVWPPKPMPLWESSWSNLDGTLWCQTEKCPHKKDQVAWNSWYSN